MLVLNLKRRPNSPLDPKRKSLAQRMNCKPVPKPLPPPPLPPKPVWLAGAPSYRVLGSCVLPLYVKASSKLDEDFVMV